jgi:MtrB/PioB family decaheme-associated outer membrane protein
MKVRAEFLITCAALAICAGAASPVRAADLVTKAPMAAPPLWWYEGFAEVGGRFNINNPDKTTLGKFYEYRDLRPGVFGNFYFGAHRTGVDPIDIAAWGKNVGWTDQAFGLDVARPGTYYLSFGWDETPHVFWKNARTTFVDTGSNVLLSPYYVAVTGAAPTAATSTFVNSNANTVDVKYRRDTASAAGRWTPSDNWDITADYSHTHRHGTQPLNVISFTTDGATLRRTAIELAKPVDDTTQNGNVKGEYSGSTPWGKPFNVALGYGFSLYNAENNSLIFNNPWNPTNTATAPQLNRYALAPDNEAHTVSLSGGVGLPWNSRYMGTFQYSWMKQDDTFLPSTINPLVTPATLTASNLNGDARTTLFNNVLNTQITPDLKSTLRYRYYDYHSNQDPITITGLYANVETNNSAEPVLTARPLDFTKQNASADLAWRATKWLTVGPGYSWERWSRGEYSDVAVTNEHTGKVFADAKFDWSTVRTSVQYGARRFDSPYLTNTANNVAAFRVKEYADRDRWKGVASWAIQLPQNIEITPNGGFRLDDYKTNPLMGVGVSEIGLVNDKSWNAGIDLAWTPNRSWAFYTSYVHENGYRQVYENSATPDLNMESRDRINTFIVGSKITVVPEKLFVDANYTYTRSTSAWTSSCTVYGCRYTPLAVFPDAHNTLQRVDVQAKYMFDKGTIQALGLTGQAFVKARLLWEKDSTDAWQPLTQMLGYDVSPADTTFRRAIFLATGSPNYDVVLGMLSVGVKW